jgi:proteasome lid subunit RPN8/RPN11
VSEETRKLRIDRDLFDQLADELRRRARGQREAGAFLLGTNRPHTVDGNPSIEVVDVAYYDDLDPSSLTGNITFHSSGYRVLGQLCRDRQLEVVADIHTHPAGSVRQSSVDRRHPMIAVPGHLAFIAPDHAADLHHPRQLGAHIFKGDGNWTALYGDLVTEVVTITEPTASWVTKSRIAITRTIGRLRRTSTR